MQGYSSCGEGLTIAKLVLILFDRYKLETHVQIVLDLAKPILIELNIFSAVISIGHL